MVKYGNHTWIDTASIIASQVTYKENYAEKGLAKMVETDEVESVEVYLIGGAVIQLYNEDAQHFADLHFKEVA